MIDGYSKKYWRILGNDIKDCVISGASAVIDTLMIFDGGKALPGRRVLSLTPQSKPQLEKIWSYTTAIASRRNTSGSSLPVPDIRNYPPVQAHKQSTSQQINTSSAPSGSPESPQNQDTTEESTSEPDFIGPSPTFLAAATDSEKLLTTQRYRVAIHPIKEKGIIRMGDVQFFKTVFTVTLDSTGVIWYFLNIFNVNMTEDVLHLKTSMYYSTGKPRPTNRVTLQFESNTQCGVAKGFVDDYMRVTLSIRPEPAV